ncbi:MAG: phosphoethanolamine transferase [Prevotella sp.]|nr:phosphoethanolamine transferase [Prevotella sp.]
MKTKLAAFISGLYKTYKYSIAFGTLLFVLSLFFRISYINTYVLAGESEYNDSLFKHLFFSALNAFILFSPLIIFSKTFLRIPVVVVLAFLASFDVGLIYFYKAPMNEAVIASVFESNMTEATGVLLHLAFVWLPAFGLFGFLALKASLEINRGLKRFILLPSACLLADVTALFVLPLLTTLTYFEKKDPSLILMNIRTSSFIAYFSEKVSPKYPFIIGDMFLAGTYLEQMTRFNGIEEKGMPSGVVFRPDTITGARADKIILVVGESARRENHSLYGYPVKTTPFLDSLASNKEYLSCFQHVISPSNFTRDVLRMTFSYATPSNGGLFLEYGNLLKMAKDAGYKTCWISTQDKFGSYNSIMNLIAKTADRRYFHTGSKADDLELLPHIQSSVENGQRQFIVVHINGSHWPYHRFDGDDTKALGSSDEVTDYNKTIRHTDRLLRGIYRIAGALDENVLIYYYSDHGEIIGKTDSGYNMHGLSYKYKIQYHVPLVVMQNRPFIAADSIVNKYYDGQTGRLNTLSNIYILGELMGFHVSDSLIEQSKIDGRYVLQGDGSCVLYEKIKD